MVAEEKTEAKGSLPSGFPSQWEFAGLLTNGESVLIRPIQPHDAPSLVALHATLTTNTAQWRNFGIHPMITEATAARTARVDYRSRMAFVAFVSDRLVGSASYDVPESTDRIASVSFVIANEHQRRGIATLLFETLAAFAWAKGIERFIGEFVEDNTEMLGVFEGSGLQTSKTQIDDKVRIQIELRPTPKYRASCDRREANAEVASIGRLLRPQSIAVVGAGRQVGSVGHELVHSLLAGDFSGTVYPVNPLARSICGAPAFATLSALPEPVDLVVVAVPATLVPGVVEEAALAGAHAVTVISAGFAEVGDHGANVEAEMLRTARRHGMRIVGPNCLGIVNTDPEIRMNATFTGLDPLPGKVALVSQSGAVGIVLAEQANAAGIGLSSFVSVGNKLDVSSTDLLCFFEHDERTSVIALYLESVGNPRKFARIARRIGEHKPIVVLKAGKTSAGARGARSHTAAAATPDVAVSALLRSAGAIKVDRLEELLDVSSLLLGAKLPAGRRVALVGNAGGPLILAADACESAGLPVPEFGSSTQGALGESLVPAAAVSNPVDLTAGGVAADLERALEIVLGDDSIDAVITVVTDLAALSVAEARATIARVAARSTKPVVACLLGGGSGVAAGDGGLVPEVPTPERAAAALDYVARYAQWRRTPRGSTEELEAIRLDPRISKIVSSALASDEGGGWLNLEEAAQLLDACRVPVASTVAVKSATEAASVAESMGFPVVLKARSGAIVHKSGVGGVALALDSPDAVRDAYKAMASRLGDAMGGAVLQPMASPGIEVIVGLAVDPAFGPVVMVGLGGVITDLLGDHAFAVPPFDPATADAMVGSLRAAPLLDGYRGSPAVDRKAIVAILEKIATIADQIPELVELDLNPILVTESGALVVDCKARLAARPAGPGLLFRAL